jgi:hypothetical protein
LSGAQSAEKKKADARLMQRLKSASPSGRAKLAFEYYQGSVNTNRIVIERSIDTSFVLDHVEDVLARIPGWEARSIERSSARLVGVSYSSANDGANDDLLPSTATRLSPADTTHLNYHDIAALLPVLRYVHVTGRTNATSFLAYRNRLVREFHSGR